MNPIKHNSLVSIHYRLLLEDGTEVESNFSDDPLVFTMGDGTLTEGMEHALLNQITGNHVSAIIKPAQGYGYPDDEKVHHIPLEDFGDDFKPEPGQVIAFDGPNDEEFLGTIISVSAGEATVDFSHPLAGRTLTFNAEILEVTTPQD